MRWFWSESTVSRTSLLWAAHRCTTDLHFNLTTASDRVASFNEQIYIRNCMLDLSCMPKQIINLPGSELLLLFYLLWIALFHYCRRRTHSLYDPAIRVRRWRDPTTSTIWGSRAVILERISTTQLLTEHS